MGWGPWLQLTAAQMAGANVALIPDLAARLPPAVYWGTVFVYLAGSTAIALTTAWIGRRGGDELPVIVRRLCGRRGKRAAAAALLCVSLPASMLSGGFYGPLAAAALTGLPFYAAAALCTALYMIWALGYGTFLLKICNYSALLWIPLLAYAAVAYSPPGPYWQGAAAVDWRLALALLAYHGCGLWSALGVETAARLAARRRPALGAALLAKSGEAVCTLAVARWMMTLQTAGPLAAVKWLEPAGGVWFWGMNALLFCTLLSAMGPAMLVNARQMRVLTQMPFRPALGLAGLLVGGGALFDFNVLLDLLTYAGLAGVAFILWLAWAVRRLER